MQTEQAINSGNFHILKPHKALKKAFLKVKPNRSQSEQFKQNLIQLLDRTNDTESEEFHKNLVTDFLKKTWNDPNYLKENPATDTSTLEAEIDRLAYQLYDLTDEEIQITENSIN